MGRSLSTADFCQTLMRVREITRGGTKQNQNQIFFAAVIEADERYRHATRTHKGRDKMSAVGRLLFYDMRYITFLYVYVCCYTNGSAYFACGKGIGYLRIFY